MGKPQLNFHRYCTLICHHTVFANVCYMFVHIQCHSSAPFSTGSLGEQDTHLSHPKPTPPSWLHSLAAIEDALALRPPPPHRPLVQPNIFTLAAYGALFADDFRRQSLRPSEQITTTTTSQPKDKTLSSHLLTPIDMVHNSAHTLCGSRHILCSLATLTYFLAFALALASLAPSARQHLRCVAVADAAS